MKRRKITLRIDVEISGDTVEVRTFTPDTRKANKLNRCLKWKCRSWTPPTKDLKFAQWCLEGAIPQIELAMKYYKWDENRQRKRVESHNRTAPQKA